MAPAAWASHRVLLTWDPNPETDIAGYRIHFGTSSRVYSTIVDVGNVTNTIVTNLASETTYYFAATAYNTSSLESDLSEEVSLTTPTPGGPTITNQPPTIALQTQFTAQKQTATALTGVQVSDPDGSTEIIQLNLTANRGILTLSSSVAGGLTTAQINGNRSKAVQVVAPLVALNTTLNAVNGLLYTGDLNLVGTDTLSATVKNSGTTQPGTNKTALIQVLGNAFDTWRNQYFSATDLVDPTKETTVYGDLADPELDGIDNLQEFALGLNPATKQGLEEVLQVSIAEAINGEKRAQITFPRRKNQTLLQYQPEVSSDRLTWSSGAGAVVEISRQDRDATFEMVVCQDLTGITPTATRFIRLKILRIIQ